jgi:hypothetical protein
MPVSYNDVDLNLNLNLNPTVDLVVDNCVREWSMPSHAHESDAITSTSKVALTFRFTSKSKSTPSTDRHWA